MIFIECGIFSDAQENLLKNAYLLRFQNSSEFDYFIIGHKTKISEKFFFRFCIVKQQSIEYDNGDYSY